MANAVEKMKALEIEALKLVYFPVPKVASTSMKNLFFELEHGKPYQKPGKGANGLGIHNQFVHARQFYNYDHSRFENYARIAVIRDPAERILSAYSNKVERNGELSEENIDLKLAEALKLEPDPTRHVFIKNLDKYRLLSPSIYHHTDPISKYLGPNLNYYTDIYKIGQLDRLAEQLSLLIGREVSIEHQNKSSKPASFQSLGPPAQRSLLSYCAGDYALLRDYYQIPKLRG